MTSANQPLYYAQGGTIFQRPAEVTKPDGSKSLQLGFPAASVSEFLGDDTPDTIATLMNRGEMFGQLLGALNGLLPLLDDGTDADPEESAIVFARAVIADASALQPQG